MKSVFFFKCRLKAPQHAHILSSQSVSWSGIVNILRPILSPPSTRLPTLFQRSVVQACNNFFVFYLSSLFRGLTCRAALNSYLRVHNSSPPNSY